MSTYRDRFGATSIQLDHRAGVGPHHLAIGKTRKLFEWHGTIHAFFSRGYEIAHARIDADSLELRDIRPLRVPVAWGGGAFCIDHDPAGAVTLVFLHRNKVELAVFNGQLRRDDVEWSGWRPLLRSNARMAAPWVETDPDGNAWCSVLARDGSFQIARVRPDGSHIARKLFSPDESSWYHSCVQMLPLGRNRAVAVGFRGQFPAQTELVFKSVTGDLEMEEPRTLAPCNVNDATTFHFQAAGDPTRGLAHVVFLDDGLTVSHAMFHENDWTLSRNIFPRPAYAPQICVDDKGALALIVVDYHGAVWTAAWTRRQGWSSPRRIEKLPRLNISASFGRTGYGTGGLISAARSPSGRVPFLMGIMDDDRTATASLHASTLGLKSSLELSSIPVTAAANGTGLRIAIRLANLRDVDLQAPGRCWMATIPGSDQIALRIAVHVESGLRANLFWQQGDGTMAKEECSVTATTRLHSPFNPKSDCGCIEVVAKPSRSIAKLQFENAWVEIYSAGWSPEKCESDADLADIGPFELEPAAAAALDPGSITQTFRRII